jgi:hypothetical protein
VNWWKFDTATLGTDTMLRASSVTKGVWLGVLAWCVSQENGGVVPHWEQLTETACQRAFGCPLADLQHAVLEGTILVELEDGGLLVEGFPHKGQAALNVQRKAGSRGGAPPGPRKKGRDLPPQNPPSTPEIPTENPRVLPIDKESNEERNEESREFPHSADEVFDFVNRCGMAWTRDHAAYWFHHMEERGWMLGPDASIPCRDWRSSVRKAQAWVIDAVSRGKNSDPSGPNSGEKKSSAPRRGRLEEAPIEHIAPEPQDAEPADWREAFRDIYGLEPVAWSLCNDDTRREIRRHLSRRERRVA